MGAYMVNGLFPVNRNRASMAAPSRIPRAGRCATDTQADSPHRPRIEAAAGRTRRRSSGPTLIFGIHAVEAALGQPEPRASPSSI